MIAKKHGIKNVAASTRSRLLNVAKFVNRDFNAVLLQYFQERFLYRLSISRYHDLLILKGALLFLVNNMPRLRPTKDIDFLGSGLPNDQEHLEEVIREIIQISVDDGVIFDPDSLSSESITVQDEYPGIRIHFEGNLSDVRKRLQIDIGFGDEVIPEPVEVNFPILLDSFDAPVIMIYSLESAIAEKFESIVKLNYMTSRMKDFYDIWYLSQSCQFGYETLRSAILTTFSNRETDLNEYQVIFSDSFKNNSLKNEQWQAFLNRNKIECKFQFSEIIEFLKIFLLPICIDENAKYSGKNWDQSICNWQ